MKMRVSKQILKGLALAAAVMVPHLALASPQLPVVLGAAAPFQVLANTAISGNGTLSIVGNVGLSPSAGTGITVLNANQVTGTIYTVDGTGPVGNVMDPTRLTLAMANLLTAYNDAAGRTTPDAEYGVPTDIGGTAPPPGLYKFDSSAGISGSPLTLTGSASDVWIFQIASTLTVAQDVVLTGGALAQNVFWQVGSSATIAGGVNFKGTIMALTAITVNGGGTMEGRELALNAAVTFPGAGGSAILPTADPSFTYSLIWSNPVPIKYGTALSGTQLNATNSLSLAGSYVYLPTNGAVLRPGTHTLNVVFTPTDAAYSFSTTNVSLMVYNGAPNGETVMMLFEKQAQTITFAPIPNQTVCKTVEMVASASSGLPVTFTVISGPASIYDEDHLRFSGSGRVVVVASQSGSDEWEAAIPVTNSFDVVKSSH